MRNVLVTGGSRGLGLGIAAALADAGFRVIAVARSIGQLEGRTGDALHFRPFDLADTAGLAGLVKSIRAEFGPLYGLVNNAGVSVSGVLANTRDADIARAVQLNVLSPLLLSKYAARSMMTGSGGRVVNIASVVAATGYSGLAAYSATKSSMVGFTRSLARELGPLGITVNAVAPGFIETEMTAEMDPATRARITRRSALGRAPEVADVAAAVAYLFSDAARNITGTVLTVDAGNTA